ncbi:MAG TPA: Gfo/Idh/MocA family oxidoreductase [Acidimicrobiales bacterium]|nr:Gfo/Idh/MocA family oxidoreductase [Acidimicrobiales bacterium]
MVAGSLVRVGFLGAGFIATFHSKLLRASGVAHERAGVHDLDRDRAEAFVAAAGGFVADSEDEVLGSCDAVFICTWTSDHEERVRRAVDAGLAVFVEKPLSTDLDGARRVTDLLAGTTHQVGLVLRRSPAYGLVQSILEDTERNGRIMSAMFRDDQVLPTGGRYASAWRADASKAGSGVLLEHSIHDVDLIDRLLGPVTSVSGHQRSFHEIDGIEDLVVATFELEGGGVATLTTVWHDLPDRNSLRYLEIHCERAFISVEEDWFGPVRYTVDGATQEWSGDGLMAECQRRGIPTDLPEGEFIRAVAEGGPATPDAAVALRAHELVDAVYRSAAAGGAPTEI